MKLSQANVLVFLDGQPHLTRQISETLKGLAANVRSAHTLADGLAKVQELDFHIMILSVDATSFAVLLRPRTGAADTSKVLLITDERQPSVAGERVATLFRDLMDQSTLLKALTSLLDHKKAPMHE